jgi:hypothetical protein
VLRRYLAADVKRAYPELTELVAEHLPGADGAELLDAFAAYAAADARQGNRCALRTERSRVGHPLGSTAASATVRLIHG